MNSLAQIRQSRALFTVFVALMLACFALSQRAQAVSPPPDGAYPGGNTAEGQNALLSRTTGIYNTAVGIYSLLSLTDGNFCTGIGAGSLLVNTADQNTAIGAGALLSNITGFANTANGAFALFTNTEGDSNTATGRSALQNNIIGNSNTANGYLALFNNTASGNTAVGHSALFSNTTGGTLGNIQGLDVGPNVAVGWQALESNTVASANTAVGYQALQSFTSGPAGFEQFGLCTAVGFQALANNATDGFGNSAFGYQALKSNTTATGNTAIGFGALRDNTASGNTAIGYAALFTNTTGFHNTASGEGTLSHNTMGNSNTAIGRDALINNTIGNANVALRRNAGALATGDANVYIGDDMTGVAGESNACYIRSIFGATSASGLQVFINSDNKLGTVTSSKRFKEQIKPMHERSGALFSLQPVSFRYKKEIDPAGTSQFGLVAEEVERVNPDLVVHDKEGKPYSVRYDQVNAMLLNEFLKEHRKVQEQEATIAQLRKDFQASVAQLTARLEEQASQIQKVSAQFEASKPPPQMVSNNP